MEGLLKCFYDCQKTLFFQKWGDLSCDEKITVITVLFSENNSFCDTHSVKLDSSLWVYEPNSYGHHQSAEPQCGI